MRKTLSLIGAGLLIATLAACSTGSNVDERECLDVPTDIMTQIADGANGAPIGPVAASAVRSESFDDATIVAMSFDLDGAEEQGVWAVGGTLDQPGSILAIDAIAAVVTDWPNHMNGEQFDITEDGASEAVECLAAL